MKKIIGYLVIVLVPLVLLLSATRFLLTPLFVNIEYHTPGFPEDTYGMTLQQRLHYAPLALDYLLNDEGVEFLGDQTFEDGSPLYNERELSHMEDVKDLTKTVLNVWILGVVVLVGIGAAAWHFDAWADFQDWLSRGGQAAVMIVLVLLVFIAVSFDTLFTEFHHIFFQGDSWLFLYSDTLIRLFPMRFWQDVFITLAGVTLLGGGALWRWMPRKADSKPNKKRRK
jgi:integral membrane protein (TIGR01906 family)